MQDWVARLELARVAVEMLAKRDRVEMGVMRAETQLLEELVAWAQMAEARAQAQEVRLALLERHL